MFTVYLYVKSVSSPEPWIRFYTQGLKNLEIYEARSQFSLNTPTLYYGGIYYIYIYIHIKPGPICLLGQLLHIFIYYLSFKVLPMRFLKQQSCLIVVNTQVKGQPQISIHQYLLHCLPGSYYKKPPFHIPLIHVQPFLLFPLDLPFKGIFFSYKFVLNDIIQTCFV